MPFADFNALKLPPGTEHEEDFALLADIFPTVRVATYPFVLIESGLTEILLGLAWSGALGKYCI